MIRHQLGDMAITVDRNSAGHWQYGVNGVPSCPVCHSEYENKYGDLFCDECSNKNMHMKPEGVAAHQRVATLVVNKFLSTANHSPDGGWPVIEWSDIHELYGIVDLLSDLKYGNDVDGDSPLKTLITPRKTHYLPWDMPLNTTHHIEDPDESRRVVLRNIDLAAGAIRSYSSMLDQQAAQLRYLDEAEARRKEKEKK